MLFARVSVQVSAISFTLVSQTINMFFLYVVVTFLVHVSYSEQYLEVENTVFKLGYLKINMFFLYVVVKFLVPCFLH